MAAGFNIENFRGALTGGGARPNLFDVTIDGFDSKFTYTCKGASLPGTDIGTVEVPYFGRNIKLPGNRTFPEWTATVINDEDFFVHERFVDWITDLNKTVANVDTGQALGGRSEKVVSIYQRGKTGNIIKTIELINAWPSSLAGIDLAWDSNDAVEEFAVTFQYDYWRDGDLPSQLT